MLKWCLLTAILISPLELSANNPETWDEDENSCHRPCRKKCDPRRSYREEPFVDEWDEEAIWPGKMEDTWMFELTR